MQKSQKIVKTSISQFQGRWSTAQIAAAQIVIVQILTALIVIARHVRQ